MTRRRLSALFAVLATGAGACANTADGEPDALGRLSAAIRGVHPAGQGLVAGADR